MKLQKIILTLMSTMLLSSSPLLAADFDWMVSLNVRSHSDPYSYRYGLIDRFGYREHDVIVILDSVYAPADAYMIFRLAELSHRPPEYILHLYRERRHHGWGDIAHHLGIRFDSNDYIILRERHDMRTHYRPPVHYEERRYREPVRRVVPEPKHHEERRVERKEPTREPLRRESDRREKQPERRDHHDRHDDRNNDRRDERR